jgi:bacteriocin secretion accessory protein
VKKLDKRFLESSEFYNGRYNNFSTILIIPMSLLLIGIVGFSLFAKREITVTGVGTLEATQLATTVQATTNSAIEKNYLSEGKYVKKGQTLLIYNNVLNRNKLKLYQQQLKQLQQQKTALKTLRQGIIINQDSFKQDDAFGYRAMLQSYLKQRQIYQTENQMLAQKANSTKSKQASLIQTEQQVVDRNDSNLQAYQNLYTAINQDKGYASNAKYSYIYQEYKSKLSNLGSSDDKSELKDDTLASVQQQIDSLQDSVASAKVQVEELQDFDSTNFSVTTNNQKMQTLQSDQLNTVAQDLIKVQQSLKEVGNNIVALKSENHEYTITAPKTGVLHVNNDYQGIKYISSGTAIATIYPILKKQKFLEIKAYISTTDISEIKIGQNVRFKVSRNVPKSIVINGKINKISVSPITVNHGSYYVITSKAKITNQQKSLLKYGMSGKISVITGKKTFFNYYKDKLLNKS